MRLDIPRAKMHLIEAGKQWPNAWRIIDGMRAARGRDLPEWPEWCFLPLSAAFAIVNMDGGSAPEKVRNLTRLGALAAWRVTQGIYRFHPSTLEALWETPVAGELPIGVLYRLPEWCVYVEIPEETSPKEVLNGFFAHLEYDTRSKRSELRFLIDLKGSDLIPLALHLVPGGLDASIQSFIDHTGANAVVGDDFRDVMRRLAEPMVSLVLYLCSQAAEYRSSGSREGPMKPSPVKTKRGPRLFPPQEPTVWETGFRIGEEIRSGHRSTSTGSSVRPHIRRAHWHGYWLGPRSEPRKRRFELYWLPPIPVNIDSEEIVRPTIRHVD